MRARERAAKALERMTAAKTEAGTLGNLAGKLSSARNNTSLPVDQLEQLWRESAHLAARMPGSADD